MKKLFLVLLTVVLLNSCGKVEEILPEKGKSKTESGKTNKKKKGEGKGNGWKINIDEKWEDTIEVEF